VAAPHPAVAWTAPLTVADYATLPVDPERGYELQEGVVMMAAKPLPDHQDAVGELYVQLRPRVPGHLKLLIEVEALLVVEVLPPGTRRVDTRVKHDEYADAGIPHYWMVDLAAGPALTACHLGGAFGYADDEPVTGTLTTDVPFPATVDLSALP
jgi:Uma2 family endonuclease